MSYILDAWYMLAWARELSPTDVVERTMLARTILEMPIVAYRSPDTGEPVAMFDRCPHRFAPLSRGSLVDGHVRCGYHGLSFDHKGRCVGSLFGRAPPAASVRTFPVVEKGGIIWIWCGDAERADAGRIPSIPHHEDPAYRCVSGINTTKANYRLIIDNLMDLSHTALIHPGFGGLSYIPKVRSWEEADGSVITDHQLSNVPNFLGPMFPSERVNHQDKIRWIAPSVHLLDSTTTSVTDPNLSICQPSAHILTPETAVSTHYFWSSALPKESSQSDEELRSILAFAFDHEDKPMIEAVQARMGATDFWDLHPVLLANDVGAIRARRRLDALIAKETTARSTPREVVP